MPLAATRSATSVGSSRPSVHTTMSLDQDVSVSARPPAVSGSPYTASGRSRHSHASQ